MADKNYITIDGERFQIVKDDVIPKLRRDCDDWKDLACKRGVERARLGERVSELEKERLESALLESDLRKRIKESEGEREKWESAADCRLSKHDFVEGKLEYEVEKLRARVSSMTEQCHDWRSKYYDAFEHQSNLRESLSERESKCINQLGDLSRLQKRIEKLEEEKDNLRNDLSASLSGDLQGVKALRIFGYTLEELFAFIAIAKAKNWPPSPMPIVWVREEKYGGWFTCDICGNPRDDERYPSEVAVLNCAKRVLGLDVDVRVWGEPKKKNRFGSQDEVASFLSSLRDEVNEGGTDPGEASLAKWDALIQYTEETRRIFIGAVFGQCGLCCKYYGKADCPLGDCSGGYTPCTRHTAFEDMARNDTNKVVWLKHAREFRAWIAMRLGVKKKLYMGHSYKMAAEDYDDYHEPQHEWIYGVWKGTRGVSDSYYWPHRDYQWARGGKGECCFDTIKEALSRLLNGDNWVVHLGLEGIKGIIPVFGVRRLTPKEVAEYGSRFVDDAARFAAKGRWAAFYNGKYIKCTYSGLLSGIYNNPEGVVKCVLEMLTPAVMLDDLEVVG